MHERNTKCLNSCRRKWLLGIYAWIKGRCRAVMPQDRGDEIVPEVFEREPFGALFRSMPQNLEDFQCDFAQVTESATDGWLACSPHKHSRTARS